MQLKVILPAYKTARVFLGRRSWQPTAYLDPCHLRAVKEQINI